MTRLAVVAYPALSEGDRRWIERIRVRNDPLALRIAAHFTLVFPTEVAEAPLVAQVRNTLRFSESIPVVLRRAAVSPNVTAGNSYVSLLADEGHTELLARHDALYDSILAARRRRDIPFIPHVTVGRHELLQECEQVANQLNEQHRSVRARVDSVDIVEIEEPMVRTVAQIRLGSRGN
jgi:2'-5' RNA ligase